VRREVKRQRIVARRLRAPAERRGAIARAILGDLPAWFAIPEAVEDYASAAARHPMFVTGEAGAESGFLVLVRQAPLAWEIDVMAVRVAHHRHGAGRALLAAAEDHARARRARYLTVKTLAPSAPDRNYARTRAFYRAMGFDPLEVFPDFWTKENPCLLMVKALA
jgi:GNAT superfamily N-acetyltransferase